MGSALLSRFDLVFILIDKPDDQLDLLLSEHVMSLHTNKKRPAGNVPSAANSMTTKEAEAKRMLEAERPLSERLKVPPGQVLDLIPPQLLRKYISYARKYVQPKVTAEAASVLQEFYLSLRQQLHTQDTTPITMRQLESLIRLSEARARLELREEVTKEDAMEVVEIMKFSMMDVLTDNFGFVHFQRSQHGSGMSNHSKAKKFIAVLQKVSQQTCNALFTVQEMRQLATESHLQVPDFENFVSSLNNQGYLIKKGPRVYQVHIAV